jgi:hypothetical protein
MKLNRSGITGYLLLIAFLLLIAIGCSNEYKNSVIGPVAGPAIENNNATGNNVEYKIDPDGAYPQFASRTFYNISGQGYNGGMMVVPGGTHFMLWNRALTPPPNPVNILIPDNTRGVTITMLVEKVETDYGDELVFTFGPHGCQFDPPAEVIFDWTDLNIQLADLFYLEEGKHIPQDPNSVDINNKRMTLYISHFSRYALGVSR